MTAVLETTAEATILRNVSWKTYESLLEDYQDCRVPRFSYDQGNLEIMSPTPRHEKRSVSLGSMVEALADGWNISAEGYGSTTFKRADIESGFEPDECFYIQNAAVMIGAEEIDLGAGDLPPDLIIEIEITHPSLAKFPIYARIGVPEVWRQSKDGSVSFFALEGGMYREIEKSLALPKLSVESVNQLLSEGRAIPRIAWLRRVRAWARETA